MKSRTFIAMIVLTALTFGCRRQDIRIARIHVPQMKGSACEQLVLTVVKRVPGVKSELVTVDRDHQDVTVPYDSLKLSLKNIEYALAEAGLQANDIPADEKARAALPEPCR